MPHSPLHHIVFMHLEDSFTQWDGGLQQKLPYVRLSPHVYSVEAHGSTPPLSAHCCISTEQQANACNLIYVA